MDCERARLLLDAYVTDELDLAAAVDVEQHLQECFSCGADLDSIRDVRRTIAGASLCYTAPPDLRQELSVAMNDHDVRQRTVPFRRLPRFAAAAAIAVLLLLPSLALYWNVFRAPPTQLADQITASHIRSLMGDHLLDVPSTDQHTVKPWFPGKLDFSPAVVDLTAEGFPLIGGRLDYIDNRPVAAIVYQRHKHIINLFTWPGTPGESQPTLSQHNGYNLLRWTDGGMTCVAVSDLNSQELRQFADRLTSATSRAAPTRGDSSAP